MISSLSSLAGSNVDVSAEDIPAEFGQAPIAAQFSNGVVLRALYWRVIQNGNARISSFDHEQVYGLPARINAIDVLRGALGNRHLEQADFDETTGDLRFSFSQAVVLQVLNLSGYEVWELRFPDGVVEYSNYNK